MRIKLRINKVCETWLAQARGLMFSKRKTLLFKFKKERRVALHNCFVFFPIKLIFLDRMKRVVEIKEIFRPFAFYRSREKAMYLIETPHKADISIGDLIEPTESV